MDSEKIERLKKKFISALSSIFEDSGDRESEDAGREKVVVFVVALFLALGLWFMVNLSRDYNISIRMPLVLANMPEGQALTETLPDYASVNVTGEGWQLLNVYNNPPRIYINATQREINLYEQVRQQMNAMPDLNVQKVQPLYLNLSLDERGTKKVPLTSNVHVSFAPQHDFVGSPRLQPDSVEIIGAQSLLKDLGRWETDSVSIENVDRDINTSVPLKPTAELLTLSRSTVRYMANVSQYTEGQTRVRVQARNMPSRRSVSFSPSHVTVRFDVPIEEYVEVEKLPSPYSAYVRYEQIRKDSTGFVIPNIEKTAPAKYHIRLRSFQPSEVAYFMIVEE